MKCGSLYFQAICTPNINLSGEGIGMREYTRTAKFTELKNYDHLARR
jgi:hypothetical protein